MARNRKRNRKKKNMGARQQPARYKLPHQDLLAPPCSCPEHRWESGLMDLLDKTKTLTHLRGGPLPLPPETTAPTSLPKELFQHLQRLYLWTVATGTPGHIPAWYATATVLRVAELLEAGAAYKSAEGHIFLAGFHSMETQASVSVVEDPAELAPFIPNSQKDEPND